MASLLVLLLGASLSMCMASSLDQQEAEAVLGPHGNVHMRREESAAVNRHDPIRDLETSTMQDFAEEETAKPKVAADDGPRGPPGPSGARPKPMAGPVGLAGINGNPGLQGDVGAKGAPGFAGGPSPGPSGPIGGPGHEGAVGDNGPQGQIGPQGMQGPTWDGVANAIAMINFASNLLDKVKAVENIDDDRTEQLVKRVDITEKELGLDGSEIEADQDEDNEINQLLSQGQNLVKQVGNMNQGTAAVVAHQKAEADAMADEVESAKKQAHDLENAQKKNGAAGLQGGRACLTIALVAALWSL